MADPTGLVVLGVGGFTVGMLIGMALKALARIAMYVVGLYLASLLVLSSFGLIIVNWEGLASLGATILNYLMSIARADALTSMGAFGVATTLGMIYGAVKAEIRINNDNNNFRFFKKLE